VPSATYNILREAILSEKRIACTYNGQTRELCPIVLGRSNGQEKVLTYQVGGGTDKGTLLRPNWKCLFVAKMQNPRLQEGPWLEGANHSKPQSCVEVVELDINPRPQAAVNKHSSRPIVSTSG
jgi:hypothetical protein